MALSSPPFDMFGEEVGNDEVEMGIWANGPL